MSKTVKTSFVIFRDNPCPKSMD